MLFRILPKEINSEATVCHVALSGGLCLGEFSTSMGCAQQPSCLLFPSCSGYFRSCPGSVIACPLPPCWERHCIGAGLPWAVPARLCSRGGQIMVCKSTRLSWALIPKLIMVWIIQGPINVELKVVKRVSTALWKIDCVRLCDGLLKKF